GRQAGRGPRLELGPGRAAIYRLEQTTAARGFRALAARAEGPALAAEIPQAGVERLGMLAVHRDRRASGREVRALEDQPPGLAAVAGLVQAAMGAVAPKLARHGGVHDVRMGRVDDDLGDALRFRQSHAGPVVTTVGGPVDPIANRDAVAGPRLAGTH